MPQKQRALDGTGYWISPTGDFHRIRDGEHEDFAADVICPDAADAARDEYPDFDVEDSGDQEDFRGVVFAAAKKLGWTDAHIDRRAGALWLRDTKLRNVPHEAREKIRDFAIEHGLAVGDDNSKSSSFEFDARPPKSEPLPSAPVESVPFYSDAGRRR